MVLERGGVGSRVLFRDGVVIVVGVEFGLGFCFFGGVFYCKGFFI